MEEFGHEQGSDIWRVLVILVSVHEGQEVVGSHTYVCVGSLECLLYRTFFSGSAVMPAMRISSAASVSARPGKVSRR